MCLLPIVICASSKRGVWTRTKYSYYLICERVAERVVIIVIAQIEVQFGAAAKSLTCSSFGISARSCLDSAMPTCMHVRSFRVRSCCTWRSRPKPSTVRLRLFSKCRCSKCLHVQHQCLRTSRWSCTYHITIKILVPSLILYMSAPTTR